VTRNARARNSCPSGRYTRTFQNINGTPTRFTGSSAASIGPASTLTRWVPVARTAFSSLPQMPFCPDWLKLYICGVMLVKKNECRFATSASYRGPQSRSARRATCPRSSRFRA